MATKTASDIAATASPSSSRPPVRRNLRIGQVDDAYEREADRLADTVMRMPEPTLQRACAKCKDDDGTRLRRKENGSFGPDVAPPIVHDVLGGPGRPLDPSIRSYMEPRFGHDFSRVRVHTDARAAESAHAVGALAYTVGENVVFGEGSYRPESQSGQRLIAHELAHVVQQNGASGGVLQRQAFGGCSALLANPPLASYLSGTAVHAAIQMHFNGSVPGARPVVIPGASAAPLRTGGICGADSTVIPPQIIGGRAGGGIPDLARVQAGVLQVAEIKPAAIECLIDGEAQLLGYVTQGNATDAPQRQWRQSQGIASVVPMPPSVYQPPPIPVGNFQILTAWCNPGLMAYTVTAGVRVPVPHRVPVEERVTERDRLRREVPRTDGVQVPIGVPVAVGVGAAAAAAARSPAVRAIARATWRHFWRAVITRFAIRGTAAAVMSVADGPLPFGELAAAGLAVWTIVDIVRLWDVIWGEADTLAQQEA